jgi:hypothetical protein
MAGNYLQQNYTVDIVWLCVGFIPALLLFGVLFGAKLEEVRRSLRKPAPSPVQARITH